MRLLLHVGDVVVVLVDGPEQVAGAGHVDGGDEADGLDARDY